MSRLIPFGVIRGQGHTLTAMKARSESSGQCQYKGKMPQGQKPSVWATEERR